MGWTSINPVSIGEDTKKSEWDILWDNCDFTYIEPTTVMLFGQSAAPTGWTKKTDWTDNSMLVYTTGAIGSGGSDDPTVAWTTAIAIQNESNHTHPQPHTHILASGTVIGTGSNRESTTSQPSAASTGAGSAHSHGLNQDTFTPKYVKIIAATKDSGSWTAANPVAVGNAMKANAHWTILWANADYCYLEATTVQFFGQTAAPTGWTKKTDWTDSSMLIYTTGNLATGGSDDPASWTTTISTNDESSHTHSMQAHTHTFPAGTGHPTGFLQYTADTGSPSVANTGTGSAHSHGVNQDTFTPKYQEVIAATKDSGNWTDTDPVSVGNPTKKNQYDTLWDNVEFNYFAATTIMLFGQTAAPTGWTKKVDWTDNSMLVYTTETVGSGGSDSPISWTTAISIQNESAHTHSMQSHTHTLGAGYAMGINAPNVYNNVTGGPSTANTSAGTAHTHTITAQDTMTLKYQEVIAATKDA